MKFRRKSERVMAIVPTLEKEVIRIIRTYKQQSGRPDIENVRFYDKMASEFDSENSSEIIFSSRDFNGHVGKRVEGYEGAHEGNGIRGKN